VIYLERGPTGRSRRRVAYRDWLYYLSWLTGAGNLFVCEAAAGVVTQVASIWSSSAGYDLQCLSLPKVHTSSFGFLFHVPCSMFAFNNLVN
jgi:hypothetical protein